MPPHLMVDTSVSLKWWHSEGEDEVDAARALLMAHRNRQIRCVFLDLAFYELGNVLMRSLHWPSAAAREQLHDVTRIVGRLQPWQAEWTSRATVYSEQFRLSFYDAAWAAAAAELGMTLVSADEALLQAGLAESATSAARRLGLLR